MKRLGLLVYRAELAEAQADPVLAALHGRSPTSTPFDRLGWLRLMADECFPGETCFLAVARDGDAVATLPLRQSAQGLVPLANWYSFTARPQCNDPACFPQLLQALIGNIGLEGALHFSPLPQAEATAMHDAFRASGWVGTLEPCDANHILTVAGRSFAQYWASRPGQLRETVRRKGKKGVVSLRIETSFNPADWDAYEAIYGLSWKPGEGNPRFLRRFAQMESDAGALRLGIAEIDGKAVAAQFWTVEGGTAFIHKLAHDEAAKALSPGTLLSAALFEHVIDRDRVSLVDFGTGNDPYKRDWMDGCRTRYRVEFYRPAAVRHWKALAKQTARRLLARRPLVSAPTAG